jgi:hypothetical protein
MKRRNGLLAVLLPVVITISLYLVFSSRITSKPGDAGFWLILVMGISIGVVLARIFQWPNKKK